MTRTVAAPDTERLGGHRHPDPAPIPAGTEISLHRVPTTDGATVKGTLFHALVGRSSGQSRTRYRARLGRSAARSRRVGECYQAGESMGRPAAWAASSRRLS